MRSTEDAFTVYGIECRDGTQQKHQLKHRTMRNLALIYLERLNRNTSCGPHRLLTAQVSRSPWVEVASYEPEIDLGAQLQTAPLTVDCLRCGARAGQPCEDLSQRKKGIKFNTRWPHPLRVQTWNEAQPK